MGGGLTHTQYLLHDLSWRHETLAMTVSWYLVVERASEDGCDGHGVAREGAFVVREPWSI